MVHINEDANGGHVEVSLGELFEIHLSENPTTGYQWRLRSTYVPVMELQDESFQSLGGAIGGGGERRWRFRAIQEGTVHLEIEKRRAWENLTLETFTATVKSARGVPQSD